MQWRTRPDIDSHGKAGEHIGEQTVQTGQFLDLFPVVDLACLAGGKFQTVELFGLTFAQAAAEAFDAVVGAGKSMAVDQVLLDDGVVSLGVQLGFDEGAVELADRGR